MKLMLLYARTSDRRSYLSAGKERPDQPYLPDREARAVGAKAVRADFSSSAP